MTEKSINESNRINAIVTMPPYAPFLREVIRHKKVSGIRLNTVMPTKGALEDLLNSLNDIAGEYGKELYIDLKCRQLRVKGYHVPPFTEIELTHKIYVKTPTLAYFSDGEEVAEIVKVDGNRLIMLDGPKRVIGPGESVNIVDKSLKIDGFLTDTDKKYIEASQKVGIKNYMLSFVESIDDVNLFYREVNDAKLVAKIESCKGIDYVNNVYKGEARLMAARGDLYVEVGLPHKIVQAVEDIVKKDSNAIVASRLFGSLAYSDIPSSPDIGDVDNLLRMGYKTFMLGDEICMRRNSVIGALNCFEEMAKRYEK